MNIFNWLLEERMRFAIPNPQSQMVIKNVSEDDIRAELEELRALDPDTHARLTEIVVLPEDE